jgi:hypothetical protein
MLPMHVSDRKQHPPLSPQGGWLSDGRQVLHFQPCRYDRWSQSLEVVVWIGDGATADLLVLSQVVLSLQLPFAVIPLMIFCANRQLMAALPTPRWLLQLGWLCAGLIVLINAFLLVSGIAG